MKKWKVASLFSGIGGFETGIFDALGRENIELVFSSEIDKYASAAYAHIYEHVPHGDITEIRESDVPDHDILVGGFPCQAFSIAGRRLGFEDTRGTLFFDIARIAQEKKPKVMVLENVKGLVSHDGGQTLEVIIKTLSDLNYKVDMKILNSRFHGVPQNRERIFIVAMRDVEEERWNIASASNTFLKAKKKISGIEGIKMFNFNFPTETPVYGKIADILEETVDKKYYLSDEKSKRLLQQLEERHKERTETFLIDDQGRMNKKLKPLDISPTLRREMHGNEPRVVEVQQLANEMKLLGMLDMKGNQSIRRVYDPTGLAPTLTTMGGGHREPKIAVNETYATMENGKEVIYHYRIRKLTPLECFRLQGFPDTYYHLLRDVNVSDSQLYKMAGNAVTTNVISAIFQQVQPYLKEKK